ncbi:DUF2279 domain-containing protein [Hymenobacter sp. UV11]|uniref:DUF2279 domain-containing protein n=1 Tax=Hymenobacter sp. UV11 TaxID=1849735 RepID=UPI00105CB19E|nr:DUF2279 domain-containing protein [Hymenobacter sp. UV11]TDN37347.1 DUF2279 domain-containing protein [Hymenobacter sp. UV11]TFZ68535.1 DUF2279 domain-containing protein [Hymenobacter sp. UV11]
MRCLLALVLLLILNPARAQVGPSLPPDPTMNVGIHQGRFIGVVVGTTVVYALTSYFLGKTWYTKRVPFHTFNDNGEWLQMDKVGHATTAYAISRGEYELFRWSGVNERASVLTGSLIALLYQTTIELFDGRSEGWGFSKGDMVANLSGIGLFMGQQYGFGEQKASLRYGWRQSIYPQYRPNLLGHSIGSQMLKDYNGQQYWLSFNIASVLPVGPSFPRWLNLDVGYSGSGMTGGHANPPYFDAEGKEVKFTRYRQFYVSPDISLARLPGLNGTLAQPLVSAGQFFKIPTPSLEYSGLRGLRFHPLVVAKD